MKKFKTLFLGLIFFIVSSINAFGYNDASSFFTALYYPQAAYFMTDRIGVLVGTNNFRFMGTILSTYPLLKNYNVNTNEHYKFTSVIPSVFVGFAYTNSDKWFGVGGGYELDHYENGKEYGYMAHTPVIALSFLEKHALKLNFPVSIGYGYGALKDLKVYSTFSHARYNIPNEVVNQVRLYVLYGHLEINKTQKIQADSLGFQFGIYFHAFGNDKFSFDPYLTLIYYTSIKDASHPELYSKLGGLLSPYNISATAHNPSEGNGADFVSTMPEGFYAEKAYFFSIRPRLGLTAESDFITLYGEPIFSYNIIGGKNMKYNGEKFNVPLMQISYGLYIELYINPTKELTLFLEADMRGNSQSVLGYSSTGFSFDSCTGLQWFF
ncbi:hypothetical protein [Brachyspira aalborgi]|uniref:Cell surface protein n=1 Tax=Brachyspira aalborgi TaxID=29522 RepID=A0A5C8GBU2_9SPIR|nr:hypothetical protein [Brachyspira aalborgi]TXJ59340.1 hypothetical protein EPJ74_09510 [Brachyspira aalborgi]